MDLSVVIPTYNEEAAIAENVRALVHALNETQKKWELILVNDGSTDGTLGIVQELARHEPKIRVVSYAQNRGRGYALRTGFRAAHGTYVIATESDLTWGADIIHRFLAELERGDVDIVIASPHMKGGRMENVPFGRWLLSFLGNKIFSFALPGHLTMATGMTRGYRREVLEALDLESDGKELHVEILYKALDLGFRVREIPATLRWKKRSPGVVVRKSHFKFRSIFGHLLLSFSVQPFILFGTTALLFMGAGILIGFFLLAESLRGMPVAGRPLLFVSVLSIMVGVQIFVFGFLANQNRALRRELLRLRRDLVVKRSE